MTLKERILHAAKATDIPEGFAGQWQIYKHTFASPRVLPLGCRARIIPAGTFTQLCRHTLGTVQRCLDEGGPMAPEVVMEDSPQELNTHLEFMLKAHGNVLITGLGLGCVLRGTMQNPRVQHVTVIERDLHVVNLVWPFIAPAKPCTLIISDALQWVRRFDVSFDCAWHDLWSDPDKNEPHLQETHMKLVCELHPRIPLQGAWQFPRMFRKVMSPALL